MIFPYAPLPPPFDLGGTKRNLPFLQENLKRHEVSVLSYGTPEEELKFREVFGSVCKEIVFVDRRRARIINGLQHAWLLVTGRSTFRQIFREKMQRRLDDLLASRKYDLVHCCTQLLGFFRFPEALRLVSDTHEVTYQLIYRTYKNTSRPALKLLSYLRYRFGKREEIQVCQKFDALIATQAQDYEVFQRELPGKQLFMIHNGVQESFLQYHRTDVEPGSLVFTGLMTHYPNEHGVLFFLDEVFPLIRNIVPHARLYIVGAKPSRRVISRESDSVVVTGFVEDVRPYMSKAEVYIIPLLIGGGIRGKALEAMAMKKPIVTTTIGCEGIKLKHEESALFADTPEEFARAVVRLLDDSLLRERLTHQAYQTVLREYNWTKKGEELDAVYRMVASQKDFSDANGQFRP